MPLIYDKAGKAVRRIPNPDEFQDKEEPVPISVPLIFVELTAALSAGSTANSEELEKISGVWTKNGRVRLVTSPFANHGILANGTKGWVAYHAQSQEWHPISFDCS